VRALLAAVVDHRLGAAVTLLFLQDWRISAEAVADGSESPTDCESNAESNAPETATRPVDRRGQ
jgi:hypothetical protein